MITNFKIYEAKLDKKKINFEWTTPDGIKLKFRNITVYKDYAYVPMMGVSQVIRQYIKQRWKIPFQISSSTFAGGDSVNVYISPVNVSKNIYEDIKTELNIIFKAGDFNGMEDIYEYRDERFKVTVDGKEYTFSTKYLSVDYEPKFGTKEYAKYEEWKKMNKEFKKFNL